ncbi:hypothetical protein WH279_08270 [Erwinia sp. MYb375]|uniref:hypothetical protein n=1 Tax=unclassified Erwinia TaxID=2622719 RepID=UPI0030A91DF2
MPGFNYGGGKGDGTGWSRERGSEPSPGGGSTGNAGNHDKGKGSASGKGSGTTPGISRSVGDTLALKAGLNPAIFTGYFINEYGQAIGISPLVGGYVFGVNLGPAPANPDAGSGNSGNGISGNGISGNGSSTNTLDPFNSVIITFKGDTSDTRIAALNKIIANNARMANSGQAGQRIRNAIKATKQAKAELAVINAARKQKAAKQAAEARAKAEAAAKAQREAATNRLRSASVQAVRGVEIGTPASTAPASWAIASAGAITLGEDVAGSLLSRISAVLTELRGIAAASLAGTSVPC